MTIATHEELAIALAAPLLVVVAQMTLSLQRRLRRYYKARCVLRIATMIISNNEPRDEEMHALQLRYTTSTIRDAVIFIGEYLYGTALNRLSLLVEVCNIEYAPLQDSRLKEVAIFIEAYPHHAMLYVARLNTSLSWLEVALLSHLLRRTATTIAYTPLLTSKNRNLQLVGIYLCEHFSIADSEAHLQRLIESKDEEVSFAALCTLCSLHGDISSPQVWRTLMQLAPHQRMRFLRHTVRNCYSLRSCSHMLTNNEKRVLAQRVNSYKCSIVCN